MPYLWLCSAGSAWQEAKQVTKIPAASNLLPMISQFEESVLPLLYRLAGYFMLTVLDDPAMLALAFC